MQNKNENSHDPIISKTTHMNALILNTDGTIEEVFLKTLQDYQRRVGGCVELLPVVRKYISSDRTKKAAHCYVNEEGLCDNLPLNPFAALLSLLGMYVNWGVGGIYGNVIILSEEDDGDDGNVDPFLVTVAKRYKDCEDLEDFIMEFDLSGTRRMA